jgi:hypothetical protein
MPEVEHLIPKRCLRLLANFAYIILGKKRLAREYTVAYYTGSGAPLL